MSADVRPSVTNRPSPAVVGAAFKIFIAACAITGAAVTLVVVDVLVRHWPTGGAR